MLSGAAFAPGLTQEVEAVEAVAVVPVDPDAPVVRILNASDVLIFVACGTAPFTPTAAQLFPIAPGAAEKITKGVGSNAVAVVQATGEAEPSLVYVTTGAGL